MVSALTRLLKVTLCLRTFALSACDTIGLRAYALALLTALHGFASTAHAEAGALLSPVAEAAVPDQDRLTAQQAIIAYFAQFPDAIPITPPEEGVQRAGARFRSCGEPICASEFARALDVDFAVVVRLFAPDRRGSEGSLSVALVTPDGTAYSGNVEIEEAGVHAATTRGVQLAHERLSRGPGPWLKVDGPDGSRVRVDGRAPQALPYTEKHEPGLHRIVVESQFGSLLYDGTINLPDDPAHYEVLEVENRALPQANAGSGTDASHGGSSSYWSRKRSKWNYIIGVPLAVAGLAYTAVGAVHYASRDDCTRKVNGVCEEERYVNAHSKAALALGLAGVAVGTGAFLFAGVIRERDRAPSGVSLNVGGSF